MATLSRFFETASPMVYVNTPILPMTLAKLPGSSHDEDTVSTRGDSRKKSHYLFIAFFL